MTDRPIIFSAPMIRSLLEGRKSQTRRVLKPQPEGFETAPGVECDAGVFGGRIRLGRVITTQRAPYAPGDRLWVKETWRTNAMWDACSPSRLGQISRESGRVSVLFEAGGSLPNSVSAEDAGRTRSPIHMPRWASRLTLLVTDVRVQRLKDISEGDAIAEGAPRLWMDDMDKFHEGGPLSSHRCGFLGVWTHIYGPDAWDANPWVVAVSFETRRGNIDA